MLTFSALKIHCSQNCKEILDKLDGYILEERGQTEMKVSKGDFSYRYSLLEMLGWGTKWVKWTPNGTNSGLFKIGF